MSYLHLALLSLLSAPVSAYSAVGGVAPLFILLLSAPVSAYSAVGGVAPLFIAIIVIILFLILGAAAMWLVQSYHLLDLLKPGSTDKGYPEDEGQYEMRLFQGHGIDGMKLVRESSQEGYERKVTKRGLYEEVDGEETPAPVGTGKVKKSKEEVKKTKEEVKKSKDEVKKTKEEVKKTKEEKRRELEMQLSESLTNDPNIRSLQSNKTELEVEMERRRKRREEEAGLRPLSPISLKKETTFSPTTSRKATTFSPTTSRKERPLSPTTSSSRKETTFSPVTPRKERPLSPTTPRRGDGTPTAGDGASPAYPPGYPSGYYPPVGGYPYMYPAPYPPSEAGDAGPVPCSPGVIPHPPGVIPHPPGPHAPYPMPYNPYPAPYPGYYPHYNYPPQPPPGAGGTMSHQQSQL